MIHILSLSFFAIYIVVAGLHHWAGLTWPGVDKTLQALLACAALAYLPVLAHAVRSGEIALGTRIQRRYREPFFFWLTAALKGVVALIIAGAMLMRLLTS